MDLEALIQQIHKLSPAQLGCVGLLVGSFQSAVKYRRLESDIIPDDSTLEAFGDGLRIHHAFSEEPLSKDKFEFLLQRVLAANGFKAQLASKGNPGHDITINGIPVSLKSQANKGIDRDSIWISKFMEMGKGDWSDKPADLLGLRERFFSHMRHYERIFTLRNLRRDSVAEYELVEIPKTLLLQAASGELKMMSDSKQNPKPGYCHVRDPKTGREIYQLYFDGGTERKLQVKNLLKIYCPVHAIWEFPITKG